MLYWDNMNLQCLIIFQKLSEMTYFNVLIPKFPSKSLKFFNFQWRNPFCSTASAQHRLDRRMREAWAPHRARSWRVGTETSSMRAPLERDVTVSDGWMSATADQNESRPVTTSWTVTSSRMRRGRRRRTRPLRQVFSGFRWLWVGGERKSQRPKFTLTFFYQRGDCHQTPRPVASRKQNQERQRLRMSAERA